MNAHLYLGVDPGLTGALAAIDAHGHVHLLEDLPTLARGNGRVKRELDPVGLAHLLRPIAGDIQLAVVEQVSSMPGQGVASVFSLGHSLGSITGVISALGIPLQLVTPASWKKACGISRDKDVARGQAVRVFPHVDLHRKKDHNTAEALLLARFALTNHERN